MGTRFARAFRTGTTCAVWPAMPRNRTPPAAWGWTYATVVMLNLASHRWTIDGYLRTCTVRDPIRCRAELPSWEWWRHHPPISCLRSRIPSGRCCT